MNCPDCGSCHCTPTLGYTWGIEEPPEPSGWECLDCGWWWAETPDDKPIFDEFGGAL